MLTLEVAILSRFFFPVGESRLSPAPGMVKPKMADPEPGQARAAGTEPPWSGGPEPASALNLKNTAGLELMENMETAGVAGTELEILGPRKGHDSEGRENHPHRERAIPDGRAAQPHRPGPVPPRGTSELNWAFPLERSASIFRQAHSKSANQTERNGYARDGDRIIQLRDGWIVDE